MKKENRCTKLDQAQKKCLAYLALAENMSSLKTLHTKLRSSLLCSIQRCPAAPQWAAGSLSLPCLCQTSFCERASDKRMLLQELS